MIIKALKVVLEEAELAAMIREALGAVGPLKEVAFSLQQGAVCVGGKFQAGFAIPFETRWSVEVLDGGRRLGVRLAHVSVSLFGLGAGAVTAQVMGALAQKLQGVAGVEVAGDAVVLEPAVLLAAKGIRLEGAVSRFALEPGRVEIELG